MVFVRKTLPLLLLFLLVSIAVRLPNIGRPLSKHHEFCTAVSLRVLQVWYEHGASTYHFNPIMTYGNAADRFINNFASGSGQMMDVQGNYYYVSHPPLAYYVPHAFFKVLHIYPTVKGIQYFHLLFHFLCALGVFWIVCVLYNKPLLSEPFFAAVAAFVVYLFSPATMWFQCNTYMADMFVQVSFVFGLLAVMLARNSGYKKAWLFPLCVLVFAMVYTSWLGVFFTLVLATYLFFFGIKDQRRWWWTGAVKLSMAAALALIVFQYSQINGFAAYWAEATQRAGERSMHGIAALPAMYLTIIKNHLYNYLPLFVAIALLAFIGGKKLLQSLRPYVAFLCLSSLPILLLHLVLADYSGHDFVVLYAAPFWVVLLMLLLHQNDAVQRYRKPLLAMLVVAFVAQYYFINRPGEISLSGERYDADMKVGNRIWELSNTDEVIFLLGEKPSPQVVFYTHRNIQQVATEQEARDFLTTHGARQGILFTKGTNGLPVMVKRLRANGPTLMASK